MMTIELLLLLLSPLVVVATSSWGPKHKRCPTLLAATTLFDLDNSGGLDRCEFSNLLSSMESGSSGTVSATLFNEKEDAAYNWLLCQCYYLFGLPMSCCNNTTTTEKSSSMWKEVSLEKLATYDDSIKMGRRSYSKVFCEEMMWLMDETGLILLATNLTSIDVSTTTTATTTQSLVENTNTTEPTLSPDDAVIVATTSGAAAAAVTTTSTTTSSTSETTGVKETTGLIVSSSSSSSESNAVVSLAPSSIDSKSIQASGFAVGGIIGLILAMTLITFIIVALIVANRRRRSSNNKRRVLKDDSNMSEDIENNDTINAKDDIHVENWHDDDNDVGHQGVGTSSRSSLAAMGVASLVTTQWTVSGGGVVDTSNIIDDDGSYIGSVVEEVDNCIDQPMDKKQVSGCCGDTVEQLRYRDDDVRASK